MKSKVLIGALLITILVSTSILTITIIEKKQIDQLDSWLDFKLDEWKPTSYSTMKFGAVLTTASYSRGLYFPLEIMKKQLKVLEETGLDVVRIDLVYDAWLNSKSQDLNTRKKAFERIEIYDDIINQIRADGKELMIADAGAEQYREKKMKWEEFRTAFTERVKTVSERYHPEYYIILKETGWSSKFVDEDITPEMWADLSKELCDIVKKTSPKTKTAVADIPLYKRNKEYFERVKETATLDIIGIDVYAPAQIEATTEVIQLIGKSGKEIWILETWLGAFPGKWPMWPLLKTKEKEISDAKWITTTVYYSQNNNIKGYIIFFSAFFVDYDFSTRDVDDWTKVLKSDKRTPAFYAYKNVIEEARKNTRFS